VRIIADTREQVPWTFEGQGFEIVRAKLDAGDYSVEGLEHRVSIERKSLDDWIGTVMRSRVRFYKELELLRAYEFRAVIVETSVREIMSGSYRSQVHPKAILGFITEVTVSQRVPVYLGGTRAEAQVLAGGFLRAASDRLSSIPPGGLIEENPSAV